MAMRTLNSKTVTGVNPRSLASLLGVQDVIGPEGWPSTETPLGKDMVLDLWSRQSNEFFCRASLP